MSLGATGEIPLFQLNFVGQVSTLFQAPGVPGSFDGVNAVERPAFAGVVANVVEEKELGLWPEEGRVGQAGGAQVVQSSLGQGTGAAVVGLTTARLLNGADHAQGFVAVERIDPGRAGIGNHRHVGGVDRFPAADGGTVKCQSFGKGFLLKQIGAHRQVLPLAVEIGELQVDQLNAFVLDLSKDVLRGFGHGA